MTARWPLPLLLIAFALFYLTPLGTHGLWIPDESRYAQIAQEILHTGDWISPSFMGLRYFEKPIAGYWFIAIGQAIFGDNLFGVRIASAISTGLSVLLVYFIARRLWNDPRKSFASAALYMSFGLIAGQAGYSNLDPQFTLWVNLSLVALWCAIDSQTRRARLLAWAVLGFACGMGFMTKGFLALLLPVLIALPYMIWQRRFGELVLNGLVAVLVALLVALPWVLAVNASEPDYWHFFFWHEHIQRFAGDDAQHDRPWWFYLPLLVASSLPWAALLPVTFKDAWQNKRNASTMFLLMWFLLPLTFFSLSKGKLPTYIMPCMLPLALLMGHALITRLETARSRSLRINGVLNLVLGCAGLITLIVLQVKNPIYDNEPLHLALLTTVLLSWIIVNALQTFKPLTFWFAPAIGAGILVAMIPASMPKSVVYNKMPDQFIAKHLQELSSSTLLMSNDLGAASALAWRMQRTDVYLYDTVGEVKYGLSYADSGKRSIDLNEIGDWMIQARRKGSVGLVIRLKGDDDLRDLEPLSKDAKQYKEGNMLILLFAQTPQ